MVSARRTKALLIGSQVEGQEQEQPEFDLWPSRLRGPVACYWGQHSGERGLPNRNTAIGGLSKCSTRMLLVSVFVPVIRCNRLKPAQVYATVAARAGYHSIPVLDLSMIQQAFLAVPVHCRQTIDTDPLKNSGQWTWAGVRHFQHSKDIQGAYNGLAARLGGG
ncbi:hypothetical protein Bbelb_091040 [Branchiostoma belcheri]|nr:hypothetical protein Bbelb_091040 [Branchiostoma belcheri]